MKLFKREKLHVRCQEYWNARVKTEFQLAVINHCARSGASSILMLSRISVPILTRSHFTLSKRTSNFFIKIWAQLKIKHTYIRYEVAQYCFQSKRFSATTHSMQSNESQIKRNLVRLSACSQFLRLLTLLSNHGRCCIISERACQIIKCRQAATLLQ